MELIYPATFDNFLTCRLELIIFLQVCFKVSATEYTKLQIYLLMVAYFATILSTRLMVSMGQFVTLFFSKVKQNARKGILHNWMPPSIMNVAISIIVTDVLLERNALDTVIFVVIEYWSFIRGRLNITPFPFHSLQVYA